MEVIVLGFSFSVTWLLVGFALVLYVLNDVWIRSYWSRHGIKSPSSIPVFGNTLEWRKGIQNAFLRYSREVGDVFGVYDCHRPGLAVADLDILKDVMVKKFGNFYNRNIQALTSKDMDEAVFFLEDEKWKNTRNVLTPTFSAAKMKHMSPLINDCATRLLNHIEKRQKLDGHIECRELFGSFVVDTIACCAFGLNVDSQANKYDPFFINAKKAFTSDFFSNPALMIISILPWTKPIFEYLDFNLIDKTATHFFADVVKKSIAMRHSNTTSGGRKKIDYLQLLIDAMKPENADPVGQDDPDETELEKRGSSKIELTERQVIAQALIFFLAGYETTNTTSGFLAYLLATNPEVQEKLLAEIDEVAPRPEDVGYKALSQMPYLDQVFNETMRLYPAAPLTDRICNEPFEINGFTVPKGMRVFIPIYSIHHDPKVWPNPEVFDPERFSKDNREKQHPLAWMPFGTGPRNCIGMRFAIMETKILMVRVLQKFKLETCPQTEMPPKLGVNGFLSPPNGFTLRAVKRI